MLRGRKARFTQLLRAGELGEAQRWHVAHDLARYGVPPPPAASPIGPDHACSDHGGEGLQFQSLSTELSTVYSSTTPNLYQDFSLINLQTKLKVTRFLKFCSDPHVMGVT